ncbi:MAG TPA: TetR/AcrR family transcriptional regulator [Kribbella sp.]|nr:TetR/AcrR family transcriptional regulator [Kribbella sp.]
MPKRRRGPSLSKRRAIFDAARRLFLERGFAGTTIEDVAAAAGVSKQTIYTQFTDKETLFTALVTADVGRPDEPEHPLVDTMPHTDDLERDLREFARLHLALVMTPELLRLRRMLIGEAERFPQLARAWYDSGPERSCRMFKRWFTALTRRGLLNTPDPGLAAQTFNWLVLSIPLNKAMAVATEEPLYTPAELDAFADEAVRVFLAAYGRADQAAAP